MSIVKIDSPAISAEGTESKGNTGTVIMILAAAALAYLGYRYFQKQKAERESAAQTSQP